VPITTDAAWVRAITGVTVPDVRLTLETRSVSQGSPSAQPSVPAKCKSLDERRGSLLFTHFGLSGPVVLDISRTVTAAANPTELVLVADFLPDQRLEQVEASLRELATREGKRQLAGCVAPELPRRLVEQLLALAGLPLDLKGAELSKKGRADLAASLKAARIPIAGTRGFAKAEVTAGGVSLAEIDSRTMESKLVPGLYFAGEILDLDGPIGGYNFQAAFSTGYLAGMSV
jgi:hypothetical protein